MHIVFYTAILLLMPSVTYAQAPVDFATFLGLVERNHPEAAAAQLATLRSKQAEAKAGSFPDPDIAVTRQYLPLPGAGKGMDTTTNVPMSQLTLTQTIPWPGTLAAQEQAAKAATEGVSIDEKMAATLRRLAAKDMFIDMVRLAETARFEKTSVSDAESIVKSATARLRNAVGSHHELIQAQNEKAVHTLNLAALEADLQNLQDHAAEILGLGDVKDLSFDLRLPEAYAGSGALPAVAEVDLTRERRLQAEVDTTSRFAAERKRSLPHLTASGMVMQQDDGMRSVGVMLGISLPVFSGRIRSSLDDEQATASAQTSLDLAWHDRKRSLALKQNQRRLMVLAQTLHVLSQEIVPSAKQHLQALLSDYALGRASFAAASTAREKLLRFEFAEADARQSYARAIVARERILAGFEGDSLDQPTPQVLGNMGGQSGEMGTGKGGMGPAAPKGIGGRSEATGPGGGAATPATEEPSKASGGMGSM